MTVALILGLLVLAVIFGWAAEKVSRSSLLAAFCLSLLSFACLALAVIVAGAAITSTGGAG